MKRRIGIKRRLMAQRLINKRRWVGNNIESDQGVPVSLDALADIEGSVRTRLPKLLPVSLAA